MAFVENPQMFLGKFAGNPQILSDKFAGNPQIYGKENFCRPRKYSETLRKTPFSGIHLKNFLFLRTNTEQMYNGDIVGQTVGELNNSQRRTLEFIITHQGCTASEISEQLGIPFSTIDKHIRVLLAQGLIERRGGKKAGGYYTKT